MVFLGRHFLFTCSDTFTVECRAYSYCLATMHSVTRRRYYDDNSRPYCVQCDRLITDQLYQLQVCSTGSRSAVVLHYTNYARSVGLSARHTHNNSIIKHLWAAIFISPYSFTFIVFTDQLWCRLRLIFRFRSVIVILDKNTVSNRIGIEDAGLKPVYANLLNIISSE